MPSLLRDEVLGPLRLTGTNNSFTRQSGTGAARVLLERRQALGIPPGTSFYEDSTFWNPS